MSFQQNPLSLSVPDEHFKSWAASNGEAVAAAAAATTRRPSRDKGRSLALLTVDDLLKKARPWREFMGGSSPAREFSVPRTMEDASFKLSENVYEFIGNYLLIAVICVCCVLYKRPVALVGILVTSKAWEWLRKQEGGADDAAAEGAAAAAAAAAASPGGARTPRGGRQPAADADAPPQPARRQPSRLSQLKQLAVTIFTWAVMMFSHVVPAMILAALATLSVVCLHGLLRNPVPPLRGRRLR